MNKCVFPVAVILVAGVLVGAVPAQDDLSVYVTPDTVPVRVLDATAAFEKLTAREKHYAHWMSVASWVGAVICFEQVSAESPAILELLLHVYSRDRVTLRKEATRRGVTDQELHWLDGYAARFLSNTGNYLSFGDSKFVPRVSPQKVGVVIDVAAHMGEKPDQRLLDLWTKTRFKIWSLERDERELGLDEIGTSGYYGEDVTQKEIERVKDAMQEAGMEAWNTRVFRRKLGGLTVRVASVRETGGSFIHASGSDAILIQYGDFKDVLTKVNEAFEMAYHYAANDDQRKMIREYIAHFRSGSIDQHKDAMRAWVKDKGPVVETNLGFIETYRDPMHVRAEWEGLVAIVNKEQSAKFGVLVDSAEKYIPRLPWPKEFEHDVFKRPDFTSLEVLCFANGGIPAGINIPNYDEIRQNEGFKNVSLGNVLRGSGKSKSRVMYIGDEDQGLYKELRNQAFEVQVGLHELLGHGSGKLLMETAAGKLNFDRNMLNPLTGERVKSWYKPGQTWGSQFGRIASSWEECRAEAVGIYLCTEADILKIFHHQGREGEDITYVNWLSMARAGLAALPFYNPNSKAWGQAHMQGRYALLRVMMEAGEGFVEIAKNSEGHYLVRMDRSKINSVGRPAIGKFLRKLNILKATANVTEGQKLYAKYTAVDEKMLGIRSYGQKQRKPRHLWVQPVTDISASGKVILRAYPGTYRGVIDSFLDRYDFLLN
ncbi:MAG: hypothetical protein CMJ83_10350 [Planctomycetes bacterium]|nr:hypothetical protein [Planctomycetota bacterium]